MCKGKETISDVLNTNIKALYLIFRNIVFRNIVFRNLPLDIRTYISAHLSLYISEVFYVEKFLCSVECFIS